jgi:hypothetical protein
MEWMNDDPVYDSQHQKDTVLCSRVSKLALEPKEPPGQSVPVVKLPEREDDHTPPNSAVQLAGVLSSRQQVIQPLFA